MSLVWGGVSAERLNEAIKDYGGYGFYSNTNHTQGSPLVISQGATQPLDFNNVIREKLPSGLGALFSSGRIRSDVVDATYDLRIGFYAAPSVNNGAFSVAVDISAAGDGSIVVAEDARRMIRGGNDYQFYTIPLPAFSAETYVANGGLVRFTAVDGNISLYGLQLLVIKTT